jgi:hypothetical protein
VKVPLGAFARSRDGSASTRPHFRSLSMVCVRCLSHLVHTQGGDTDHVRFRRRLGCPTAVAGQVELSLLTTSGFKLCVTAALDRGQVVR